MAAASGLSGWLHRVSDSDVWWSFKSSPMTVAAAVATFLIIAVAFLSPVLAPHTPFDPATLSLSDGLKPPVLVSPDGDWAFPLGTDDQGRDVLSSIMYGTRLSLVVSLAAVAVAMVLGISLGLISGYFGGAIDAVIMRVADVQLGLSPLLIMVRHVLPNVTGPVLVIATLNLGLAIITEATLSFLGVGLPSTEPSLGTLIRLGNEVLQSGDWWITVFPGITLAALVLAVNLLGDWLRDALNPKLR